MQVNITVKNLGQFRRAFALAPLVVKPHLEKAIYWSVLAVGRRSRQLTPVDTGRLRASHREVFRPLEGEISTNTDYDIYVHEGTKFMKARPYLRDALDQTEPAIQSIFHRELQAALDKIARSV